MMGGLVGVGDSAASYRAVVSMDAGLAVVPLANRSPGDLVLAVVITVCGLWWWWWWWSLEVGGVNF